MSQPLRSVVCLHFLKLFARNQSVPTVAMALLATFSLIRALSAVAASHSTMFVAIDIRGGRHLLTPFCGGMPSKK
jgi:hypothetical protein